MLILSLQEKSRNFIVKNFWQKNRLFSILLAQHLLGERKVLQHKDLRRSRPARLAVSPLQTRLYVNSPPYDPQTVCRLLGTIRSSSGIPVRANTGWYAS